MSNKIIELNKTVSNKDTKKLLRVIYAQINKAIQEHNTLAFKSTEEGIKADFFCGSTKISLSMIEA